MRPYMIVAAAACVPLLAGSAVAQNAIVSEQKGQELRGDWLLGARVTSMQEDSIGSIEDLIIDQESGEINAAIVSVGGFLGFGAKQIAVDWKELQIDYDGNLVELDLTREEAEEAEEYVFRERVRPPQPEPEVGTGTSGTGTGGTSSLGTGTGGSGYGE